MSRAPFQVLVFAFKRSQTTIQYALLSRSDDAKWQGITGGGEGTETPIQAARRESLEEAGIAGSCPFIQLQAVSSIPVNCFRDAHLWGNDIYVIPEHSFGVDVTGLKIALSTEHHAVRWESYADACALLSYDSNKTSLWELNQRLLGLGPHGQEQRRENP